MKFNRERILAELQMMTNIVTDDIDYLVYLVLKDGSYFDDIDTKYEEGNSLRFENKVEDFENWLSSLEEVKCE